MYARRERAVFLGPTQQPMAFIHALPVRPKHTPIQAIFPRAQRRHFINKGTLCVLMNDTTSNQTATLFSVPVSNFSARVRYIIYDNNLDIKIEPPGSYLKTPEYRQRVHKYGKFPALVLPTGESIWESDVIVEYLLDKYGLGERYRPQTPEKRARARLYVRVHDLYLTTNQAVLYRPTNTPAEREHGLSQIELHLDTLETMLTEDNTRRHAVETQMVTLADIALAPTLAMYAAIMPKWHHRPVFRNRPRLQQLLEGFRASSETAARVLEEIESGVQAWEQSGRFEQMGLSPVKVPNA
jgi:glutathione S-transferase